MARQYIAVRFRPNDRRTYTYHHDGEPVAVGDKVKIPGKKAEDGWTALEVAAIVDAEPGFPTKAILGKVEPEAPSLLERMSEAQRDRASDA